MRIFLRAERALQYMIPAIAAPNFGELLAYTTQKGLFAKFPISSISYYPTQEAHNKMMSRALGCDFKQTGLSGSEHYQRMNEEDRRAVLQLCLGLSADQVEGEFTLFNNEDKYFGMLEIRKIVAKQQFINASLISENALMPHTHHVTEFGCGGGPGPHIYTLDDDHSRWSIHCGSYK
jgi:hypothetical protein